MRKISEKEVRVWNYFYRFFIILLQVNLTLEEIEFIVFRYYNDMTYKEIRKMTGYRISRQRVQQIVRQGVNKLRWHLTLDDLECIL